ncbi:hypothetical protein MCUN1_001643 [Malassezia cuniculi]|uniref:Uncharacterized protein n=1 Tax=Malassezia cuniculi TaxID=948313 RepID=A0AAF0J6Q3_9BASI|nr:hypothetical protein MCUN1_001643 [Malassezia cuniculi]
MRTVIQSVKPVYRAGVRAMSTSAMRMESLPRGTVTPGSAVDPQLGDYPALPREVQQWRKYSPNWWDTQDRRNYGETLQEQDDVLNMWSPDKYKMPRHIALFQFLTAIGVIAGFSTLVYVGRPERPNVPKTFPRDGLAAELGDESARAPVDEE